MSSPELRLHKVDSLEDRVNVLRWLVKKPQGGILDPIMRRIGLMVTQHCPPRNDMCELQGIFDFVARNVRYTGDIATLDTFQSALRTLQMGGGDCLPATTLVLRNDYQLVALGDLRPGDLIMGDGVWTEVQESWITGDKPILAFDLSNGSTLRCSPEHRLFLSDGTEIRAEDVKVGQTLATPREGFPCEGSAENTRLGFSDTDFAWLLGVYVADGWTEDYRFAISGRDGKPKEAQKKRVEALMERAGIHTRWHEKYIAVNDRAFAQLLSGYGKRAPQKNLVSLRFTRDQVSSLLEGLRADASITNYGTVVHGTTSPVLALQLRILYRMLGQSTHIKRVDDHGGFGSNPIFRVTVRRPDSPRDEAQVKGIREDGEELCGDITTDSGKFWLPESDTLVHNCDDHSVLCVVLGMENGFTMKWRITSNTGATWDHIYAMAGVPKHRPARWVALDTTLGAGKFAVEPPRAKYKDFPVSKEGS